MNVLLVSMMPGVDRRAPLVVAYQAAPTAEQLADDLQATSWWRGAHTALTLERITELLERAHLGTRSIRVIVEALQQASASPPARESASPASEWWVEGWQFCFTLVRVRKGQGAPLDSPACDT